MSASDSENQAPPHVRPALGVCDTCATFGSVSCYPEAVGRRIRDLQDELRFAEACRQGACGFALGAGIEVAEREAACAFAYREARQRKDDLFDASSAMGDALDAADARHQKHLRDLLTLLQGAHGALPDGDVPRAAVDCLVGMVEAYLLRAMEVRS